MTDFQNGEERVRELEEKERALNIQTIEGARAGAVSPALRRELDEVRAQLKVARRVRAITPIIVMVWERMIQYQLLQSGGMAVDTPHVPHNTPEGEVGKPEGLSGSQIALKIAFTLSRYLCFLPRLKVCVNITKIGGAQREKGPVVSLLGVYLGVWEK